MKDSKTAALQKKLAAAMAENARLNRAARDLGAEIERTDAEIERTDAEIERRKAVIAEKDREIAALKRALG